MWTMVSVPVRYETHALGIGDTVRWDFSASICGRPIYLGPDVPDTCNGHFATKEQALAVGRKAIRAWADGLRRNADGTP